jgi:hypothetical protein
VHGEGACEPFFVVSSLLFHYFYAESLYANPNFDNVVGTLLQACSWAHANSIVVEHITLLSTMSDYRQQNLELNIRDRLSVAEAIVLVHHLGVTKAAAFVSAVDPWRFPHDDAPATINVKGQVQSVVAKATLLGNTLSKLIDTSISSFLLSPLLLKKGDRPSLVLKPKSERSKSSPKAVVIAAATVARKPTSQPVDLPSNEGMHLQNFRPLPPSSPPNLSSLIANKT